MQKNYIRNEKRRQMETEIEAMKNATNESIKTAESNAKVLPTIIAIVAVLGDIALAVWLVLKNKITK